MIVRECSYGPNDPANTLLRLGRLTRAFMVSSPLMVCPIHTMRDSILNRVGMVERDQ